MRLVTQKIPGESGMRHCIEVEGWEISAGECMTPCGLRLDVRPKDFSGFLAVPGSLVCYTCFKAKHDHIHKGQLPFYHPKAVMPYVAPRCLHGS